MRSESETDRAIDLYSDMIRRICLYRLKGSAETEDVFQEVFLKYLKSDERFVDSEHEKAWFIRVSINACHDHARTLFQRKTVPLEALGDCAADIKDEHREVLFAVMELPEKYRDIIYLHYYDGYTAGQIAKILKTKENTVYSLLSRGRGLLKEKLGGYELGE